MSSTRRFGDLRRLGPDDASLWLDLRLRGLREHPRAFLASEREDAANGLDYYRARLASDPAEAVVLGLFDASLEGADPPLLGVVGLYREAREKTRYKAGLWGMYVVREAQGRGVGGALLDAAIAHARTMGVETIALCVDAENEPARRLYLSRGFRSWGVEPDGFRVDGESVDEERMRLSLR